MRKIAVLFLSHIYNDYVLMRYRQLQMSLPPNHKLIWVSTNFNGIDFFTEHDEIEHLYVKLRDNYLCENNHSHPNNTYLFVDAFSKISDYDYYWFIEYDVCINTRRSDPYRQIFDYYESDENYEYDADIVADHIGSYSTNHNYCIRYPFEEISEDYKGIVKLNLNKNDIHFGFYTICRLSNRLLNNLSQDDDWMSIFFEIGITTFAYKNEMKICTFQNLFSWRGINKYDKPYKRINVGSNGFLKKVYKTYYEIYPEGAIIHAVKDYGEQNR